MKNLVDHHLHFIETNREYNFDLLKDYFRVGKDKGIQYYGFSEHAYLFTNAKLINLTEWQNKKCKYSFDQYYNLLNNFKKKNKNILIGLEVDYYPQKEKEIKAYIEEIKKDYKIDFFTGSIHWLDNWGIDLDYDEYWKHIKEKGVDRIYYDYFCLVKKMVKSKLFNIIGHIDLIKIFGAINHDHKCKYEIVKMLKRYNQVVEVNTNGKNKTIKEFYPSYECLELYYKNNIEITLSSDAHFNKRVGEYFSKMIQNLKEIGFKKVVYFKDFKKHYLEI
jgi:histidinol-phosphatase (PHP family)